MHCDDVRLDLALWVGNDLDDPARIEELRRHVATCPQCRTKAKALQASMVVLGVPDPDPTFDLPESLWPSLDARIDYLERAPQSRPSWGPWGFVAAGGICAVACAWYWWSPPAPLSTPPPSVPVVVPAPPVTPPHPPGYSEDPVKSARSKHQ